MLTVTGESNEDAQSIEMGNGMSCNHAQSSHCLPYMVVRRLSTQSCPFPPHSHVSRITLFSTALAIQIFAPKELATITTLGVECCILVLSVFMSGFVMRLFSRNNDILDMDASVDNNPPTGSHQDV